MNAKVIALPQGLENAETGTITYWRLAGGAVAYAPLRDAWVAAGLNVGDLPPLPSMHTALHRTAQLLADEDRRHTTLVRPIRGSEASGFALVHETHDDAGLPRHTVHRELVVARGTDNMLSRVELRGFDPADVERIQELYLEVRTRLSTQDVGGWLVDLVQGIHAVSLRDTGGIYYLPARESVAWQCYCDVLHAVTECRVFAIPALDGAGAVEAVLDALQRESTAVLEQASNQLHEVDADGKRTVGIRALKTRADRLEVLEKKIEAYSGLLGARLNDLHARASDVAAKVGEVLLTELET